MFTLGRKIDLRYKSNLIIVILTLFTAATGWLSTGSLLSGLAIGGGVFSTWALSREVDPKNEYSAFAAAAISLLLLVYYDTIQFLVIAWLLLLLRMTIGISGKRLTSIDIASVLALTILLSFNQENSIYFVPFSISMIYFIISGINKVSALIAGGTGFVYFTVQTFFMGYLSLNRIDFSEPLTLFTIAALFLSFNVFWFISKSECLDDKGVRVRRTRLFITQVVFSLTILFIFFFDEIEFNNLIIYLSIISGITLYFIGIKAYEKLRRRMNEHD